MGGGSFVVVVVGFLGSINYRPPLFNGKNLDFIFDKPTNLLW